jgi:hypothetical protein
MDRGITVKTKPKTSKTFGLGPSIFIFIGEFFSDVDLQFFLFFGLVPKSPTHTGLICVKKTLEKNISSLDPLSVNFVSTFTVQYCCCWLQ